MLKKLLAFLFLASAPAYAADITLDVGNVITLRGEINEESVARVSNEILESDKSELYLYIASPGGNIIAGQQLTEVIKHSGKKVKCIASIAASMAFVTLQTCAERYVMDDSIIMQHVASYGLQGQDPNNWSMVRFIRQIIRQLDQEQATRLGLSVPEFKKKTRNDWWLVGREAVDAKAADKLVTVTCTTALTKKRTTMELRGFFVSQKVEFSGCPLVEYPVKVNTDQHGVVGPKVTHELQIMRDKLYIRDFIRRRQLGDQATDMKGALK